MPPEEQPEEQTDLRKYGPSLAAAISALGVGGGLYRHLRKRTLSSDPALRAIQKASKGEYTRVLPGSAKSQGAVGRFVDKMLSAGGGNVRYQDDVQHAVDAAGGAAQQLPGAVHHTSRAFDSSLSGDVNLAANQAARDIHARIKNDKWKEYEFFNKYAPESMGRSESLEDIMGQMGHTSMPKGPKGRARFLAQLQGHLREKYPEGFLVKDTRSAETGGAFPTENTDFTKLYTDYRKAGLETRRNQLVEEQGRGMGATELKQLKKNIRQRLSDEHKDVYSGRVFRKMFQDPRSAMVQAKLPLTEGSAFGKALGAVTNKPATQEMRIHVVNGALLPSLTIPRFDPSMYVTGRHHMRGAEDYARGLLEKMPKHYRNATFAMDVAPLKGGGYGLIESTPSGVSGFFSPKKMPIVGPLLHKEFTGRHSTSVAGTLAGAGALTAGIGGRQVANYALNRSPSTEENQESPTP